MTDSTQPKIFRLWTPKLLLGILKGGFKGDRQDLRSQLIAQIDERGLDLGEAAALHTYQNSETVKGLLEQLLTPRSGERTNLERILELLEAVGKANAQIAKGQVALNARLDEIELRIFELSSSLMNQLSGKKSKGS